MRKFSFEVWFSNQTFQTKFSSSRFSQTATRAGAEALRLVEFRACPISSDVLIHGKRPEKLLVNEPIANLHGRT